MSEEANVVSRTQMIIITPTGRSVSIINAGPQGPPGVGGTGGGTTIPPGDTVGEVLTFIGPDPDDTDWIALSELPVLPPGDTVGEVLTWVGPGPGDVEWMPPFDGIELHIGSSPPTFPSDIGSDGDYYYDETGGALYGPKTDGFYPPILGLSQVIVSDLVVKSVFVMVSGDTAVITYETPLNAGGEITEPVTPSTTSIVADTVGVVLT